MNMHRLLAFTALVVLMSMASSSPALAASKACNGISKKCTADKPYDKTIDGTAYSCYDCKQALCKNGGSGGLSGTSTSSVCTEKPRASQPTTTESQFNGHERMAPERRPRPRPGRAQLPHSKGASPAAVPKPAKPAPVSHGAQGASGGSKRESAASTTLSFDEADALFGKRTTGQSTKPAKPATASTPRSKP